MSDWGGDDGDKMWRWMLAIIFTIASCVFGYFWMQECTRVHPLWYCASQ